LEIDLLTLWPSDTEVGIQLIEMYQRSGILALVGEVKAGDWANTKLRIWNDQVEAYIADLEFRTQITGVKMRHDRYGKIVEIIIASHYACRLAVALDTKVFVYSLTDLKLIGSFETLQNTRGLLYIQPIAKGCIVAAPSKKVGSIDLYKIPDGPQPAPANPLQPTLTWQACSELRQMTFDNNGRYVAAVSTTVRQ